MTDSTRTCPQCGVQLAQDHSPTLCPQCLLAMGFETQQATADSPSQSPSDSSYSPTFIPPTAEELTPHFPQLEILEAIGHGGMGVVYKARQTDLDRIVALKIIRPGISSDEKFSERFQREARALARLNHPNIITVHDFGRKDQLFYFVMEYVDGTNLRHLQRTAKLTPHQALQIVPQICAALQYAHDNGVVHRDIKPENILISTTSEVRIADFGLAKLAGTADREPLTGTWQVMGTPHYMAPEQFEKPTTVDHRADIYSLGVVIYELLTGELPLGRFPLPSQKAAVDKRLDDVVLRSLDKEPDRRFQQATDVASAVEDATSVPPAAPESFTARATETAATAVKSVKRWCEGAFEELWRKNNGALQSVHGNERIESLIRWLYRHYRLIGSVLIIIGAVGAVLSPWFRTNSPFLTLLSIFTGAFVFYFGRRLRHDRVPTWLKWTASGSLLLTFVLPDIVNILAFGFLAAGLVSLLHQPTSASVHGPPRPDFIDIVSGRAKRVGEKLNGRLFAMTIAGIAGWIFVTLTFCVAVFVLYVYPYAPSEYIVRDTSALNMKSAANDYSLSISFPEAEPSTGLDLKNITPSRNSIRLTVRSGRQKADLKFDNEGRGTLTHNGTVRAQGLDRSTETILSLLHCVAEDNDPEQLKIQANHLNSVAGVMRSTAGLTQHASEEIAARYPSVRLNDVPSTSNERTLDHSRALIPVGQLIDRSLFHPENGNSGVTVRVAPRESFVVTSLLLAGMIFAIGLVRVIRVLYLHLWTSEASDGETGDSPRTTISMKWNRCCFHQSYYAAVTCLVVAAGCFYAHRTTAEITLFTPEEWFVLASTLAAVIVFGSLMAHPRLRSAGRFFGYLATVLSSFALPYSLLAYPAGLAGWIMLQTQELKAAFGTAEQSGG